jgi:hypothetical protein
MKGTCQPAGYDEQDGRGTATMCQPLIVGCSISAAPPRSRPATTAIIRPYTPQNKVSVHLTGHAGSHTALCLCL